MSNKSRRRYKQARIAEERRASANESMIDRMVLLAKLQRDNDGYNDYGYKQEGNSTVYDPAHDLHKLRTGGHMYSGYNGGGYSGWQGGNNNSKQAGQHGQGQQGGSKSPYVFHVPIDKKSDTFHCASAEIEGKCPIAAVPDVIFPHVLWSSLIQLADELNTEWIVYFTAKQKLEDNNWHVESFYFPPQTATGTSVDVPSSHRVKAGTNGALHSHVQMAAFWSATDKAHSNWPIEIVINARGNYEALVRHKLRCGEWAKDSGKVMLAGSKVDKGMLSLVKIAFVNGARLSKGKKAKEDDSPEPDNSQEVDTTASQLTQQLTQQTNGAKPPLLTQGTSGTAGSGKVEQDAEGYHSTAVQTECKECKGLGLVDKVNSLNPYEVDICEKCNGWGYLLDGQPMSGRAPEGFTQ